MKFLTVLSLFQTAAILWLLFASGDETATPADTMITASAAPTEAFAHPNQVTVRIDEQALRRIVREELQRHEAGGNDNDTAPAHGVPRNAAEDQYRREFVIQQIEYYKSMGAISPQQMRDLETEIAKLDHEGRKEALSRLMRAMNAGEIKGHL